MTRILAVLLAILVLPGCSTLPKGVAHTSIQHDYWHGYADWSRGFTVEAPGEFVIRPEDGSEFVPRSYTLNRGTLRFSIVAAPTKARSHPAEIAAGTLDLRDWDALPGPWPAFQRHIYLDGKLYRQRLVFAGGMIYELVVSGPADVFPDYAAGRFLDSFVVMIKT